MPQPGPVFPVASTPQDSSTWASAAIAWSSIAVAPWSKNATWSSSICAITPWWESNMPSSASARAARLQRSGLLARSEFVLSSTCPVYAHHTWMAQSVRRGTSPTASHSLVTRAAPVPEASAEEHAHLGEVAISVVGERAAFAGDVCVKFQAVAFERGASPA